MEKSVLRKDLAPTRQERARAPWFKYNLPEREGQKKKKIQPSIVSHSCTENARIPHLISMRKATSGIDILLHGVPAADLLLNARLKEEGRNNLCFPKGLELPKRPMESQLCNEGKQGGRIPDHRHSETPVENKWEKG